MKIKTLVSLLFVLAIISFTNSFSQKRDSVVVYDIVYLKDGSSVRGEILSFNENSGLIVIRDSYGRKYSFTPQQYNYYEENQQITIKKKIFELRPRKENEWEFGVGFELPFFGFESNTPIDESGMRYKVFDYSNVPLNLQLNAGKYFGRKHYVGLSLAYGLLLDFGTNNYFSVNATYRHQYDGYKKNVAFYIPIKIGYTNVNTTINTVREIDTTGGIEVSSTYGNEGIPGEQIDVDYKIGLFNIEIGQGFSFIMREKKSIEVELSFFRGIGIHSKSEHPVFTIPKMDFSTSGIKLGLKYNF